VGASRPRPGRGAVAAARMHRWACARRLGFGPPRREHDERQIAGPGSRPRGAEAGFPAERGCVTLPRYRGPPAPGRRSGPPVAGVARGGGRPPRACGCASVPPALPSGHRQTRFRSGAAALGVAAAAVALAAAGSGRRSQGLRASRPCQPSPVSPLPGTRTPRPHPDQLLAGPLRRCPTSAWSPRHSGHQPAGSRPTRPRPVRLYPSRPFAPGGARQRDRGRASGEAECDRHH